MENLNKTEKVGNEFINIGISHDLTVEQRSKCKSLVLEAKEKERSTTGEYIFRVRGPPEDMKVIRLKMRK